MPRRWGKEDLEIPVQADDLPPNVEIHHESFQFQLLEFIIMFISLAGDPEPGEQTGPA